MLPRAAGYPAVLWLSSVPRVCVCVCVCVTFFICERALRWFPHHCSCEWHCGEQGRADTSLISCFQFPWICNLWWACWIIRLFWFWLFKATPSCFSQQLPQLRSPPQPTGAPVSLHPRQYLLTRVSDDTGWLFQLGFLDPMDRINSCPATWVQFGLFF